MHLLVEGTFRGAEWRNVKDEGSTIHGVGGVSPWKIEPPRS